MEERYIASVDLGSYKVAVCIARIFGQDVQVMYYKESPSQGIRYSYVLNPKKVEAVLRNAINDAQQELKIKISQVIVGLPRYHVRQETGTAGIDRENEDTQIQEDELRSLKSEALKSYPLSDSKSDVIYGAVAQSFSTEDSINELESDIVGMTASKLEGNFKIFIGSRRHSYNLDSVFNSLGIAIAKKYFTPGITARAVLKDEQLENGVALLDLGAGVSSVTIFEGKILRYYAAIPFGGNSITNDIKAEFIISTELAENIKKAYGVCINEKLSSFGNKVLQINDEDDGSCKQMSVRYLSQIIDARMKEIIEALLYGIHVSGYGDKLRAGIVVTGGGVEMVNCLNFIKEQSGCSSVVMGSSRPFFSCSEFPEARSASAATTMGMIMAARNDQSLNCTTKPFNLASGGTSGQVKASQAAKKIKIAVPEPDLEETKAVLEPQPLPEEEIRKPLQEEKNQVEIETKSASGWDGREYHEPSIEETVAEGMEDEKTAEDLRGTVFEQDAADNEGKARKKKAEGQKKTRKVTWLKRAAEGFGKLFDEIGNEEV